MNKYRAKVQLGINSPVRSFLASLTEAARIVTASDDSILLEVEAADDYELATIVHELVAVLRSKEEYITIDRPTLIEE